MHWTNIGLIFVAGIHLAIGILVLLKNPKNKINLSFFLGTFALSCWVLITSLFREAGTLQLTAILYQGKLFFGLLLVAIFQIFTLFFPYQKSRVKFIVQFAIVLPAVISIFFIIFLPQYILNEILLNTGENLVIVNKIFWSLYVISYSLPMFVGIIRLIIRLRENSGFARVQLSFILISFLIPGFISWIFNIIFPFFDNFVNDWLGALLSVIFSFVVVYFLLFGGKKIYIR